MLDVALSETIWILDWTCQCDGCKSESRSAQGIPNIWWYSDRDGVGADRNVLLKFSLTFIEIFFNHSFFLNTIENPPTFFHQWTYFFESRWNWLVFFAATTRTDLFGLLFRVTKFVFFFYVSKFRRRCSNYGAISISRARDCNIIFISTIFWR